jgi:hypothetical protein
VVATLARELEALPSEVVQLDIEREIERERSRR